MRDEERRKKINKERVSNPAHPKYNDQKYKIFLRLAVYGTCDVLAKGINYNIKKITKEHPTDKGYFKEVYILSDAGKRKLNRLREAKNL